jgi:hypothetical protein
VTASGHGVDDDLVAILVDAGGVAAEDHRQPVGRQSDPPQRPDVVVVERGCTHGDRRPARADHGLRPLAERQSGQGIVGVETVGVDREHEPDPIQVRERRSATRSAAEREHETGRSGHDRRHGEDLPVRCACRNGCRLRRSELDRMQTSTSCMSYPMRNLTVEKLHLVDLTRCQHSSLLP